MTFVVVVFFPERSKCEDVKRKQLVITELFRNPVHSDIELTKPH